MVPETATGRRVLIVEDELMIRMLLEDMLKELGYAVAAEAGRLDDALAAARDGEFEVAVLDVNLSGKSVAPVAQALAERGKPFVFSTGYGDHGLPDAFRDRPALKKPFQMEDLDRALKGVLGP